MHETHDCFEESVQTAIDRSPHLSRRTLRFETSEGCVTLHGQVDSYYQKQMAQEAIRNIEGIRAIENQLEVCWA